MLRLASLLVAALLVTVPAAAQSAAGGVGSYSLSYPTAAGVVTFDSDVYVGGIYGDGSMLQAFVGTDDQPGASGGLTSVRVAGVDLAAGGHTTLIRVGGEIPVSLFVPIQLGLSYRYVDTDDTSPLRSAPASTAHLAEGTLGIGGGVRVEAPLPSMLVEGIVAQGSFVYAAGAVADFQVSEPDPYGLQANTLSLEVRAQRVLGTRYGASVGYLRRSARRSLRSVDTAGDLLDAAGGKNLVDLEEINLVRVGLVF